MNNVNTWDEIWLNITALSACLFWIVFMFYWIRQVWYLWSNLGVANFVQADFSKNLTKGLTVFNRGTSKITSYIYLDLCTYTFKSHKCRCKNAYNTLESLLSYLVTRHVHISWTITLVINKFPNTRFHQITFLYAHTAWSHLPRSSLYYFICFCSWRVVHLGPPILARSAVALRWRRQWVLQLAGVCPLVSPFSLSGDRNNIVDDGIGRYFCKYKDAI